MSVSRASLLILVTGSLLAACSGCGKSAPAVDEDGAVQDAPPEAPDAIPEPPLVTLDVEWEVVVANYSATGVHQALMLPTGIALITDRDIFLVDKTDGHTIARAPWPVVRDYWVAGLWGAIVTETGNLAVLTGVHLEEVNDDRLFVYEYSGTDLGLIRKVQVSHAETRAGGAIAELDGSLYALIKRFEPDENNNYIDLVQIDLEGATSTQELGEGLEDAFYYNGFATAEGKLLFCFNHWNDGTAELVTINPDLGMLERRTFFDDIEASARCRLLGGGAGRLLFYWHGGEQANWVLLSSDGQSVVASHHEIFPDVDTHAYANGDFVSLVPRAVTGQHSRLELYAVDAETLSVRGPYLIPLPTGMGHAGQHQVVSDGQNLYAALAVSPELVTGEIRLLKLGPIPSM